jgi:hypothetical protein
MVKITLEVSDELSEKLGNLGDRLPEILSQSLTQPILPSYVYRHILNFLASNPTHKQVSDFRPTSEMKERLKTLMIGNMTGTLKENELNELTEYEHIEHLIVMLKSGNLKFLQG